MGTSLTEHLNTFSEADWFAAVDELKECIHEVDRNAVQIWFRFYPLGLRRYLDAAEDVDAAKRGFALQGTFELEGQIDTSHHFLYGHRYWPAVKCKIEKQAEEFKGGEPGLVEMIKALAIQVAEKHSVDRSLVNAIAAVGLATLDQVGIEAFKAAAGEVAEPTGIMAKSPDAIVAERQRDDKQGLFGFLRSIDKKFSVHYSALNYSGKLPIISDEEIVTASQKDESRNWQSLDERCWDGPVPIECTSASCGTCWVGILGGQEKLRPVSPRERRQMKVFGYNQPDEERPFLRLACQARPSGNVTLVIPPWNAVFGKKVYGNVDELELEPATTSARQLREAVKSATSTD